eukprot:scaffold8707_cov128-Skeletonema_dohrnii-CCMP3373.AAC.1
MSISPGRMKMLMLLSAAGGMQLGALLSLFFFPRQSFTGLRSEPNDRPETEQRRALTNNGPTRLTDDGEETTTQMPKECIRRDLSDFATSKIGNVHNSSSVPSTPRGSNCLFYSCNTNITDCDNTLPTNYDGPKPPCCSHILRDMARIFDEEMCALGLDYVTAFGTLLGFRREGRIIPWTIDNDYIIPSADVANAMVLLWNTSRTGMAHHFHGINRMCATPDFAGGELQKKWQRKVGGSLQVKWPRKVGRKLLDESGVPYIDFYLGRKVNSTIFGQFDKCLHLQSDVFPTKRRLVYDGEFAQNFPANTDQLLRTFYGKNWMIPPDAKSSHGVSPNLTCPYGPSYN